MAAETSGVSEKSSVALSFAKLSPAAPLKEAGRPLEASDRGEVRALDCLAVPARLRRVFGGCSSSSLSSPRIDALK